MVLSACVWLLIIPLTLAVELQTSEIFIYKIDPNLFNWTSNISSKGYRYRATLANKPNLPSWLSYVYSEKHQAGFIYGVPPVNQQSFNIDIIGINKFTYEVKHKVIHLNITEKKDIAKYEVHMKVDNLNVQDLFDRDRLQNLLNIYMNILWKSSKDNSYVTFLESAVKLGARVPLRPQEGEGVVVHLGSKEEFSEELLNLQEEIRPLYKFTSCPRDLKRTSVDWHFRSKGFLLDWCKFRLVKLESESGNAHYKEAEADILGSTGWELPDKYHLPSRDYSTEMLMTLIVPICTLIILWAFLSFVLCLQHDTVDDPMSDDFFESIFEICEESLRCAPQRRRGRSAPPCPERHGSVTRDASAWSSGNTAHRKCSPPRSCRRCKTASPASPAAFSPPSLRVFSTSAPQSWYRHSSR